MSRENVEAIRRVYERWGAGDFRAAVELFDPEVRFVMPPDLPDAGTYVGAEGVADYTRGFLEPWSRITIEAEEIVGEDDQVFAAVLQSGVGRESGTPTELRYFHVWSFRDGKVVWFGAFRDRAEALQASGLRGDASE